MADITACANCRDRLDRGYFEITQYDRSGTAKGSVRVCSLKCIIQWAYTYAVNRGVQGIAMARNAIQNLLGGKPKARSDR